MLAIGKATSVDICRFFSKPGPYVSCDTMEFLLARYDGELDVDAVDSEGRTTIHVVVREGHTRVIRFCVTMGGNPNRVDSKGWTPLYYAAWKGHVKAAECLLECSNVKCVRDREGRRTFSVVAESEHEHSAGAPVIDKVQKETKSRADWWNRGKAQ
ncbi:Ankyrin repeat domain-containing protein 50 [Glycine max]|nr:Ankyrin repeat domain-containing protein 50 [Glycine max]